MLDSLPQSEPRQLHHMFPNASPEATDLLAKLLHVRPPSLCYSQQYIYRANVAVYGPQVQRNT